MSEELRASIIETLHADNPLYYEDAADALLSGPLAPLLAAVERVKTLTYANDDGSEWQHLYGCDGEPECPACWAQSIRRALDGPT